MKLCFSHTVLWAWSGQSRDQIITSAKYVFGVTDMASVPQLLIENLISSLLHILKVLIFHHVNNIIAIYQFFVFFSCIEKDLIVSEIALTFIVQMTIVHLRSRANFHCWEGPLTPAPQCTCLSQSSIQNMRLLQITCLNATLSQTCTLTRVALCSSHRQNCASFIKSTTVSRFFPSLTSPEQILKIISSEHIQLGSWLETDWLHRIQFHTRQHITMGTHACSMGGSKEKERPISSEGTPESKRPTS